jgi:hypothetical protein
LREDLQRLEDSVIDAITRGEPLNAAATRFLLRRYAATGRDDLADVAGRALACALEEHQRATTVRARADWLALFVETTTFSEDERIRAAIVALTERLRGEWRTDQVQDAAAAIAACLDAAGVTNTPQLIPDAINRLEDLLCASYEPGAGVGVGGFADQVHAASTLLTAYGVSGRLSYSMLAEELIQSARRLEPDDFDASCEAARVCCRLAELHDDPDYRAAAVVAPDSDYRRDAASFLARHSVEADRRGAAGGIYGVALLELESLDKVP